MRLTFLIIPSIAYLVEERNERSILPISTTLQGEYGISNVALSLPCLVTENGVEQRFAVPLNDEELIKLKKSAIALQDTLRKHHILKGE